HLIARPPRPTLFPYTTLFRSDDSALDGRPIAHIKRMRDDARSRQEICDEFRPQLEVHGWRQIERHDRGGTEIRLEQVLLSKLDRSEEHTSELQSRFDLVCRLL